MKKVESEGVKKLKLDDYEVGRTLGKGTLAWNSGGFGKVKVAKNKKNGKFVALKLLKKSEIIKAQQIDHVFNENFIHSQINHPFIVSFEGLAQDSRYLYLVLELINGGELFTYLRSVESLPTDQCRYLLINLGSMLPLWQAALSICIVKISSSVTSSPKICSLEMMVISSWLTLALLRSSMRAELLPFVELLSISLHKWLSQVDWLWLC